jgi:uncharacterized protein
MPNASSTNSEGESGTVSAIPEAAWNGLVERTGPFVDWRFLSALEQSGCLTSQSGWQPWTQMVTAPGNQLQAAAPAYLKAHSHGEFVFDWAWAQAAQSAGIRWYPKLLVAAPFSPVPGPRLLGAARDHAAAENLVANIETFVEDRKLSSAGVNFCDRDDADILQRAGWLGRFDWQFHWHNPGYRDFEDFLDCLKRKPRKNIRAERRRVRDAGWEFSWKNGNELDSQDLDLAYRCYLSTFSLYGNLPALNRDFLACCADLFGEDFLLCLAQLDGSPGAVAIFWKDRERLYGRYWGSQEDTRDVHFEACYYQGIEYCIRNGLAWFEPGAQGEHKIRRGFLPQKTLSFHYIRHLGLRRAIDRYLSAEAEALLSYRQQLDRLDPFGA